MTIYGEFDPRFRKRPTRLVLGVVSISLLLTAMSVLSVVVSSGDLLFARQKGLAAIALDPSIVSSPSLARIARSEGVAGIAPAVILGAVLLALAVLLLFFFPTDQRLESRLAVIAIALASSILALREFISTILVSTLTDPSTLPPAVGVAIALLLILTSERKTNSLLSAIYDLHSPIRRFLLWSVRLLPAFAVLLGIAFVSHSTEAKWAVGAAVALTFLATIGTKPVPGWEDLREPEMLEAAAMLALFALPLFAAHLWFFGLAPLREERFVYLENNKPRFASRSGIASFIRTHGVAAATAPGAIEESRPAIKMEWIKKKKR